MALNGIQIFKLTPKKNCKECGCPTCMAFSMKVAQGAMKIEQCPHMSEEALASGAGHLYGTSLPVGGKSTHSVITGHRGLVEALMFTRLDEVKEGDFFYIEVMGETLGYKVDRISVILPDDTSSRVRIASL